LCKKKPAQGGLVGNGDAETANLGEMAVFVTYLKHVLHTFSVNVEAG
jgi:ATP:corrinoid adenosyltransferase|tara:strand:- start:24195 stop:24335 length:141 start_codon:yes stop_codon:yes gene_type:complete